MLPLVAYILLTASLVGKEEPAAKNPMSAGFAKLFVDACVRGELRLPKEKLREMTWEEARGFPYDLQARNSTNRYFCVKTDMEALLVMTQFAKDREGRVSECHMRTDRADLFTLVSVIADGLGIPEKPVRVNSTDEYVITVPERHYRINIRQGFALATIFDDATSAKMLAEQRKLKHPRIRAFNWNYQ